MLAMLIVMQVLMLMMIRAVMGGMAMATLRKYSFLSVRA